MPAKSKTNKSSRPATVRQQIDARSEKARRWAWPTKGTIIAKFADRPPLKENGTRLLSKMEVIAHVNLTFPTLILMMKRNEFPYPFEVAGRPNWREGEVYAWLQSRPRRTYAGRRPAATAAA